MNSFMNDLIDASENKFASSMEEETISSTTEYIDTGSYALNGIISGDINKGIPNNKIIALAGEEATGKTYIALGMVKSAIDMGYTVVYFDSENAVDKKMMKERGIDIKKVLYMPIDTIENFRTQTVRIVNRFNETPKKDKPKLFFVLDSLGGLTTNKELDDAGTGTNKADMGAKAKLVKSVFRILSLKMAQAKIPMLITAHIYTTIGSFIPVPVLASGSGTKYAASIIIFLSKAKKKDGTDVVGNILTARTVKNRFCKPESKLKLELNFETGLNKYRGLEDFSDSLKKVHGGWNYEGEKYTDKKLFYNTEWTPELLEEINTNIQAEITFGSSRIVDSETQIEVEQDTTSIEEVLEQPKKKTKSKLRK